MLPRNAYRSFTISLAIVIVCTKSPANGFSIRRTQNVSESAPEGDLSAEESTLLEVKNDLKRPNDINAFEISKTNDAHKVDATENIKGKYNVEENLNLSINKAYEKAGVLQDNVFQKASESTIIFKEDIKYMTSKPSTSEILSNEDISDRDKILQNFTENPQKINNLTTSNLVGDIGNTTINQLKVSQSTSASLTTSRNLRETDIIIDTTPSTTQISAAAAAQDFDDRQKATVQVANVSSIPYFKNTEHQDLTTLITTPINISNYNNVNNPTISLSNVNHTTSMALNTEKIETREELARSTVEIGNAEVVSKTNDVIKPNVTSVMNYSVVPSDLIQTTDRIGSTSTFESTSIVDNSATTNTYTTGKEITNTDLALTNADTTTEPNGAQAETVASKLNNLSTEDSWKKYTTIDRRRVTATIEEISTTQNAIEITKAETSHTRVSLEEAFSVTPIASLEKLREDLIAIRNKLSQIQELSTTEQSRDTSVDEVTTVSSVPTKILEPKLGIVSSMRAGFLDYSAKALISQTTTTENSNLGNDMYGTLYEIEAGETEGKSTKKLNGVESQSQLVEDAIKEELLKEEMLSNHEENVKRYRDDRAGIEGAKPLAVDTTTLKDYSTENGQTKNEYATEDTLSVQPISHEQGKNTELYVVSPNYKPMKRIEVQPAKQFVRDPDDNSWRNESISSLGIVFKPKNSSKSFTQVLKNKTETVLSAFTDRYSKNGVPDLRERLEKMAEVRKSKKKKINKFGETIYSDYDSGESLTTPGAPLSSVTSELELTLTLTTPLNSSSIKPEVTVNPVTEIKVDKKYATNTKKEDIFKHEPHETLTTEKPQKLFNIAEYYDTTDEYDADYLTLPKVDIKKFTVPLKTTETSIIPPPESPQTKPVRHYFPDRKPTIQYFPPRVTQKVNMNDYDDDFQKRVNLFTIKDLPNTSIGTSFGTTPTPPIRISNTEDNRENVINPSQFPRYKQVNLNKNLYYTTALRLTEPHERFVANDGNFNRASYVIKHYGDFIKEAAKDDDDRNPEYIAFTEAPVRGVTTNELAQLTTKHKQATTDDEYDYEMQFRKDIISKFVDNFNQNSERFKVDFPILYNNSVVHGKYQENGRDPASSSAFMKRLYNNQADVKPNYLLVGKSCDPNCDNITVELSPAYELHYYVPDQEEKEEVEPRPLTMPYRYRL